MHEKIIAEAVRDPKFLARFWSKVDKSGECWLWTGARNPDGYGSLTVVSYKTDRAHRVAWTAANGKIPDGMHVLHSCDTPACCNPSHLRIGSHRDNMSDREARRPHDRSGEHNGRAKLDRTRVNALRDALARGVAPKDAAAAFGISRNQVYAIRSHRFWSS